MESAESAATIPTDSHKQGEGDAKDEVPNAGIVVGSTHSTRGSRNVRV